MLLLLFFLLMQQALAQDYMKAWRILDEMKHRYERVGVRATFSFDQDLVGSHPCQGEGTLLLKEGMFRMAFDGQEVINDGHTVWTYLEDENEVNVTEYDPDSDGMSPWKLITTYEDRFEFTLEYVGLEEVDGETVHVIDLVPRGFHDWLEHARIYVTEQANTLKGWVLSARNGGESTYIITDYREDLFLRDNDFTFHERDYPSVEIIEFR